MNFAKFIYTFNKFFKISKFSYSNLNYIIFDNKKVYFLDRSMIKILINPWFLPCVVLQIWEILKHMPQHQRKIKNYRKTLEKTS